MSSLLGLIVLAQAALPPVGTHYFARTPYTGPGLVCGAAFAFPLGAGESAALTKRSAIDGVMTFQTRDGAFSVLESQYATEGGTEMIKTKDGVVRRKVENGHAIWIYRDSAPGSTDVSGPAVDSHPRAVLRRIILAPPSYGTINGKACLEGVGSDRK